MGHDGGNIYQSKLHQTEFTEPYIDQHEIEEELFVIDKDLFHHFILYMFNIVSTYDPLVLFALHKRDTAPPPVKK